MNDCGLMYTQWTSKAKTSLKWFMLTHLVLLSCDWNRMIHQRMCDEDHIEIEPRFDAGNQQSKPATEPECVTMDACEWFRMDACPVYLRHAWVRVYLCLLCAHHPNVQWKSGENAELSTDEWVTAAKSTACMRIWCAKCFCFDSIRIDTPKRTKWRHFCTRNTDCSLYEIYCECPWSVLKDRWRIENTWKNRTNINKHTKTEPQHLMDTESGKWYTTMHHNNSSTAAFPNLLTQSFDTSISTSTHTFNLWTQTANKIYSTFMPKMHRFKSHSVLSKFGYCLQCTHTHFPIEYSQLISLLVD